MKIKITGLVYATIEPVREEIIIDLSENVKLNITHYGEHSTVLVGEEEYYLETNSLRYEVLL